jgi:hypothetical protein
VKKAGRCLAVDDLPSWRRKVTVPALIAKSGKAAGGQGAGHPRTCMSAAEAIGGALVGGAVAQGLSWHWIFWVNVP